MSGGGYPIPCPGGYSSHVWGGTPSHVRGVPCPRSGGVPCPRSGGVPHPRSGGVPHPGLVRGRGYPILTWSGGVLGTPPSQIWDGVPLPPSQTWDGIPPPPPARPGMGYSPPRPDWGTPPPPRCELTNKLKTVPSPILRMRAVIIQISGP